jgi:hypothetical protein
MTVTFGLLTFGIKLSRDVSLNATVSLPLYCSDPLPTTRDSSGWNRHPLPKRKKRTSGVEKESNDHIKTQNRKDGVADSLTDQMLRSFVT